jgi:hypothetical protein
MLILFADYYSYGGGIMHDVRKALEILKQQGVRVQVSVDADGHRQYSIDSHDGGYILRSQHLINLQENGKLSLSGIRELHEEIKKLNEEALAGEKTGTEK